MRKLHGIPLNFKSLLVGKVTKKHILGKASYTVFLLEGWYAKSDLKTKFILMDSKENIDISKYAKIPVVYGIKDIHLLDIGDVALVEPDGLVSIVYEKKSKDNSLFITGKCNCRCIMCPQPPVIKETDRAFLNSFLVKLISKDTVVLTLTGGEPTLMKEQLLKIIKECKNYLPKTPLVLLTNGIAFEDSSYVKDLVSIAHPDLTIAVSLCSDIDTEHNKIMGCNSFHKVIKGIYNLALFKQKIEIRTVIHKLTYQRLPNLAEFISYNFPFVVHVALMGMETTGLAYKNIEKLWIDPYDYVDYLEKAVQILHRSNLKVSIYNHQLCILPRSLWRFTQDSISDWKKIYLETCDTCKARNLCGGFFMSSKSIHSKHLQPLEGISQLC